MTWTKLESNSKKNMKQDPDTSIVYGTGKVFSKRRSGTRMEHCSYRHSVLFELIPLLMPSIELYLSNKPKHCILQNQIVEI